MYRYQSKDDNVIQSSSSEELDRRALLKRTRQRSNSDPSNSRQSNVVKKVHVGTNDQEEDMFVEDGPFLRPTLLPSSSSSRPFPFENKNSTDELFSKVLKDEIPLLDQGMKEFSDRRVKLGGNSNSTSQPNTTESTNSTPNKGSLGINNPPLDEVDVMVALADDFDPMSLENPQLSRQELLELLEQGSGSSWELPVDDMLMSPNRDQSTLFTSNPNLPENNLDLQFEQFVKPTILPMNTQIANNNQQNNNNHMNNSNLNNNMYSGMSEGISMPGGGYNGLYINPNMQSIPGPPSMSPDGYLSNGEMYYYPTQMNNGRSNDSYPIMRSHSNDTYNSYVSGHESLALSDDMSGTSGAYFHPSYAQSSSSITPTNKSPSNSFNKQIKEAKKQKGSGWGSHRGNYKCGRCGGPKVNHVCKFVDASGVTKESQTLFPVINLETFEPFEGEYFLPVRTRSRSLSSVLSDVSDNPEDPDNDFDDRSSDADQFDRKGSRSALLSSSSSSLYQINSTNNSNNTNTNNETTTSRAINIKDELLADDQIDSFDSEAIDLIEFDLTHEKSQPIFTNLQKEEAEEENTFNPLQSTPSKKSNPSMEIMNSPSFSYTYSNSINYISSDNFPANIVTSTTTNSSIMINSPLHSNQSSLQLTSSPSRSSSNTSYKNLILQGEQILETGDEMMDEDLAFDSTTTMFCTVFDGEQMQSCSPFFCF